MNYLIDTQVFIWLNADPGRLTARFMQLSQSGDNQFYLSMASVWEMQIKQQLGKLTLPTSVYELVQQNQKMSNLELMPIELTHIDRLNQLPDSHKDPFDRLIIAQALCQSIVLTRFFNTIPYKWCGRDVSNGAQII